MPKPTILGISLFERKVGTVCRNIRTLYNVEPPATGDEVRAAATQYVRKISGFATPSHANREAFDQAVGEVAAATSALLGVLVTSAPRKDRRVMEAKAHDRAVRRYGSPDPGVHPPQKEGTA